MGLVRDYLSIAIRRRSRAFARAGFGSAGRMYRTLNQLRMQLCVGKQAVTGSSRLRSQAKAAAACSFGRVDETSGIILTLEGRGVRVIADSLLRYIERQRAIAAEVIQARRDKYRSVRATNKAKKNRGQQ